MVGNFFRTHEVMPSNVELVVDTKDEIMKGYHSIKRMIAFGY